MKSMQSALQVQGDICLLGANELSIALCTHMNSSGICSDDKLYIYDVDNESFTEESIKDLTQHTISFAEEAQQAALD